MLDFARYQCLNEGMEYLVNGKKFYLNYSELRDDYYHYVNLPDEEFVEPANLIKALHFACVVLYLKNASAEMTVSDEGIIHQLVHLLDIPDEPLLNLAEIRDLFNRVLYLA